jgi:hypothetical protein
MKITNIITKATSTLAMGATALLVLVSSNSVKAEIWALKGAVGNEANNMLFHCSEQGEASQAVANITLAGDGIAVDGLAITAGGTLLGFQLDGADSRLVAIDKTTGGATPVGPWLSGIQIRGAVVTLSGQLLALSPGPRNSGYVYEVSPTTGQMIRTNGPLSEDLTYLCDIAQKLDGTLIVAQGDNSGTKFYSLDLASGTLTLLHTEETGSPGDGEPVSAMGVAFSANSQDPNKMFVFDCQGTDDILSYSTTTNFMRSVLYPDVISEASGGFNAGPGDLAAELPLAPILTIQHCVQLCWYTVTNVPYQLQYSTALDKNWYPLGGVVTGSDSIYCVSDVIPPGQPQRFYRLMP